MKTKVHLVFPQTVLEEVDQAAWKGKRSLFIVKATQEKLERERFLKTLDETKGGWTGKHHTELRTERDMEQYLREKRSSYRRRLKRIINE